MATKLSYTLYGNSNSHSDSLDTPVLTVQIYNRPPGDPQGTGLQYTDLDEGLKQPMKTATLEAEDNHVYVVFRWRTATPEAITVTSGPSTDPPTRNATARTTTFKFPVPSQAAASWTWDLEGGSPGFELKLTAKRKA